MWAAEQAKGCASEAETEDTDSDDENTQSEEGRLQQKEKEDIRVLSLGDPPVQETTSGEASEQECSEQSHGEQIPDSCAKRSWVRIPLKP